MSSTDELELALRYVTGAADRDMRRTVTPPMLTTPKGRCPTDPGAHRLFP